MHAATTASIIALLLLTLAGNTSSAPLAVSGRVVDKSGDPLAEVTVSLCRRGITAITDNEGRFLLSDEAAVRNLPGTATETFSLQGSRIALPAVDERTDLHFTALTLQGRTVVDTRVPLEPRTRSLIDPFSLLGPEIAAQLFVLRLEMGHHQADFMASKPG